MTQLTRSGANPKDIITVYCSIIRSVLEYCCQIWHPGLTKQQSNDIEAVQKRCLKIIFPTHSYSEALQISKLDRLSDRREKLVFDLFQSVKVSDFLSDLLTSRTIVKNTRNTYGLNVPMSRTNRFNHDFINYCLHKKY